VEEVFPDSGARIKRKTLPLLVKGVPRAVLINYEEYPAILQTELEETNKVTLAKVTLRNIGYTNEDGTPSYTV